MSFSSSPAPAPESADSFMPPVEGGIFDKKLAKRLQLAKNSPEPLIRESAKTVLSAERDVMEALMIINGLRSTKRKPLPPKPEPKIQTEAKTETTAVQTEAKISTEATAESSEQIILHQLKPIEGLNTDVPPANATEPAGFQPVVYKNEGPGLAEDDDSGLTIITADAEDDERVCRNFGFDEAPPKEKADEPDEWDELYVQAVAAQALGFLDRLLKKTDSKDPQNLTEKLRRDPDFHVPKEGKGEKK